MKVLALLMLYAGAGLAQPTNLAGPWKLKVDDNPRWAQPDIDDSGWPTVTLPQRRPRPERSYWLRRTVPAPAATGELELTVGLVSESYDVYANGVRIGGTGDFGTSNVRFFRPRSFRFPAELFRPASSIVIALRVWHTNVAWGTLSNGIRDEGPYWITSPEHAAAELKAARQGVLITLTPILLGTFGQVGIALCLLLLWLSQRERRELLYFAGFLLTASCVSGAGIWVALTSGSFLLHIWTYRPILSVAFLMLYLAVTAILRLRPLPRYLISGICILSLVLSTLPSAAGYALLPWVAVIGWRCLEAIRSSPRASLPFASPILMLLAGLVNNIVPAGWRLFPSIIDAAGVTFSVTDLMRLLFASAMLMLLLLRLIADRREKQRLGREMESAAEVQSLLLTSLPAAGDSYRIEPVYLPASEVGGDFYQILERADGSRLVLVGDVSGKGLKAAMQVSATIGMLRRESSSSPGAVLAGLNDGLTGYLGGGFVTCCCARFDADGMVTLANAGHPLPYCDGSEVEVESGLPLGIVAGVEYAESITGGEQFTFVSDGVVEAANAKGELFGFDRTCGISGKPAGEIAEAARAWGQNDDITVVTVRRNG